MTKENWERKLFCLLTPALMGDPFTSASTAQIAGSTYRAGNNRWELAVFLEERVKAGGGLVSELIELTLAWADPASERPIRRPAHFGEQHPPRI